MIMFHSAFGQVDNAFYHSVVSNVSYDSVLNKLITFQNLGVKSPGSTAITNTKNWLIAKYQAMGYTDIVSDNFTYLGSTLTNIVVTKTGTDFPDTYLIVDGHYDTKTGTGTNDNGSGVAIILEMARLMANIPTRYSVKFINFSAEEEGLIGSNDYVNTVVTPQNPNILLVFNIDEVGGVAGQPNTTVTCESDQSTPTSNNAVSALYTDTLSQATLIYSNLLTQFANAYGSDYVPFQTAGKIITGLYESTESTYPHSSGDNLAHLDTSYVFQVAKASTGAALYFAKAWQSYTSVSTTAKSGLTEVYPNPFTNQLTLKNTSDEVRLIRVFDLNGKLIHNLLLPTHSHTDLQMLQLSKGLYVFEISDTNHNVLERKKISKI